VRDLWLPNQQVWNHELIDMAFQQPLMNTTKKTPIIQSPSNDILSWKLTPSGKSNTKSAYCACLQRLQELEKPVPRQVQPATIQLLNHIWKNKQITPRVQTFGGDFWGELLPTGARACKDSTHISKLYARCGVEENETHLFFACPFPRAAWFNSPWFCSKIW
jgi:hypothetical protein